MAKKPVRTSRARASDPAANEHSILTLREQVERAVAADQQARAEADRARELATFRGWPERVAARRSELLLAAPVDPADALCVLGRFNALLQELCFQRDLLAHVRRAARELDAPADDRERAESAFAALLSLLEYQLYELLDAAVGHADAAAVDAAALSEAVRSPTREAVGRAGDAIRLALARAGARADNSAEPGAIPAGADESAGPALTANQSRVLETMALFDASRLVSADAIAAEMPPSGRLSARTIGPIVRRLIDLGLAERPEGDRSGARLTTAGRRLASKIAD